MGECRSASSWKRSRVKIMVKIYDLHSLKSSSKRRGKPLVSIEEDDHTRGHVPLPSSQECRLWTVHASDRGVRDGLL